MRTWNWLLICTLLTVIPIWIAIYFILDGEFFTGLKWAAGALIWFVGVIAVGYIKELRIERKIKYREEK